MADPIQFERRTEAAGFFSPLAGMEFAEDRIEIRTDPLTGMTAVASAGLEAKEEMFLGRTDWAYTDLLVARSREGCFSPSREGDGRDAPLPGRAAARRPSHARPGLRSPTSSPWRPCTPWSPSRRSTSCGRASSRPACSRRAWARRWTSSAAPRPSPGMTYMPMCCNHMLPGGASLAHPHLQVFGGETVPWLTQLYWDRSAEWLARHGASYWPTLVEQESATGERYVWGAAGVHWLVPFAPAGARETLAVVPAASA